MECADERNVLFNRFAPTPTRELRVMYSDSSSELNTLLLVEKLSAMEVDPAQITDLPDHQAQ